MPFLRHLAMAQILDRFMPGMVEQTNIMVRQVAKAAAKGGEFDLFEKITRAALVRVYTGQRTL